jgi:lipoprotein-releasing system ATP-binding protein
MQNSADNHAVSIQKLSRSFRQDGDTVHILNELDLNITEGDIVGIVGASGVGKTTLLHIIGALDRPTSGNVLFFGKDPFLMNEKEIAAFRNREIGFVFQFHRLLPEFNALENVMMPLLLSGETADVTIEKSRHILSVLGLSAKEKYRTSQLSGGEQQRVALARALVKNPRFILADEPTGNLDEATGHQVAELIFSINSRFKNTMIIVTHNLTLAKNLHKCVGLKDGKAFPLDLHEIGDFVRIKK